MKAAIYARVSTDDKSQDLGIQLSEVRRYIKAMGWKIPKGCEYVEKSSAFKGERPEFERMLVEARKRKFDVLVCYSFDRFSRETPTKAFRDIDSITRLWEVRFITIQDGIDSSNEMIFPILMSLMATQAHNYSKLHGERVKAGMLRVQRESQRLGKPATKSGLPIGRPKARITAKTLADVRIRLKNGDSLRSVASDLDLGLGTLHRALQSVPKPPTDILEQ